MSLNKKPFFSVIICTYNRVDLLKICINSIIAQSLQKSSYEIIVMDDGSSDGTKQILKQFKNKYQNHTIKSFTSKNIGLAHARNKAVLNAQGEYLAYIDDDAKADKYWLEKALKCLKIINPTPLAVSGPIFTYYLKSKPHWFKDSYEEDIKGKKSRFLKKGESFSGPNMIINRELINDYGGFAEDIDMKGDILMVGEETKFFEKIWNENPQGTLLYYSPDVKVFHLVHPYKMKISYRLKRWFASGQSYYMRNKSRFLLNNFFQVAKILIYFVISILNGFISFFSFPYVQNWVIEKLGPLTFVFGYFTAALRLPISMFSRPRS